MPATPKSTPKKATANGSTPAASPSTASTPSRLTRAQARASGGPIKTPSPLKKGGSISTPKASSKKAAAAVADDKEAASPSKSKTPSKAAATPSKASPKSASSKKKASPAKTEESPSKVPASHAKLTRKPTSALATAEPIVAEYSEEEEEDDDDDDEEEDLEEGQDVSEKGMQRLMAALGEDGLDEVDMAALDELAGNEEDEEDEEEDEDEEMEALAEDDDEDDDAEAAAEQQDADIPRVVPNANGDTLAASIARSGLVEAVEDSDDEDEEAAEDEEEDDEEAIAYEDLPDDIELSEQAKASRTQRIKINNEPALRRIYQDIRLDAPSSTSKLPWIETMRITYPTSLSTEVTDVENDLERELAFYKQALHAAVEGKKLVQASGTPFTRPSDYFAEMVKTDEHMERIRQKLLDETAAIKASEAAKKQRELKKFGKKVQVEKLQERIRNKKELTERIAGLKRKHGSIDDAGDGDEFDVRLEEAIGGPTGSEGKKQKLAKRAPTNKAKMPRNARDAKYGFGGKKKHAKSNTAESTNDFSVGPTRGARGSKPKVPSGKSGFRPKQKSGAAKRPGKARRASGH
ncbi:related to EBP2-required for pre-rRNA processing and ribosomal subunit assembly [Sporisorium reilianum SRZ2]|uniref:Related to EBP2-required for pre-rRNA processing and ribosomal subunit assembly n=1 Tax=Sporisorium reilianum (strain SRZ2) TaxID=999809 RepID=E6ZRA6_SPORE|nr:related to EBP2-required for pre-rRNA processing and ribosomal subunit assembly [Sporisorium reilianum SRZ2]